MYSVTVTDMNGCVSSSPVFTIEVHPLPTAVISPGAEICYGEVTDLTLTFTGTGPFAYSYTANGQLTNGTSPGLTSTVSVSPAVTTNYTLVTVSDAHCTNTAAGSAVVTVNQLPTPTISGINEICDGETTSFSANAGYNAYAWSNGAITPIISLNTGGTYVVTVTDGNGCTNTASSVLTVHLVPEIIFTNDSSLSCDKTNINFINNSVFDPGSEFVWDFGDGTGSDEENPLHAFTASGSYPVTLTITTPFGCTATLTKYVDITIYPLPVANFKLDRNEISIVNSRVQAFDNSKNAVKRTWDFGDGTVKEGINPFHHYSAEGWFTVTLVVENISGCLDRTQESVYVTPFFVPNAFTPNGDGKNDFFFDVGYLTDLTSYEMIIWNRWGKKVFVNAGYNDFWYGTDMNGDPVPEDTYVYQIIASTPTNKKLTYEGRVTLVR